MYVFKMEVGLKETIFNKYQNSSSHKPQRVVCKAVNICVCVLCAKSFQSCLTLCDTMDCSL